MLIISNPNKVVTLGFLTTGSDQLYGGYRILCNGHDYGPKSQMNIQIGSEAISQGMLKKKTKNKV